MHSKTLFKLLGGLLVILSTILLIPGFYALFIQEKEATDFFKTAIFVAVLGGCVFYFFRKEVSDLNHRTGLAIVALTWIVTGILGAFPYYLAGTTDTLLDAIFESVSGFTGTGASILPDIEAQARSILLWRSMTQWLGGMGIIVFFVAILPVLGMGGVQLFKAEVTGPQKDKITPRVHETAKRLWILYFVLTLACAISLHLAGMSIYDAINHSMTTAATGGFSTRNAGIAAYNNPAIEYVLIIFMLLCALNFSLYFVCFSSGIKAFFTSTEVKWYLAILLIIITFCTIRLWVHSPTDASLEEIFRKVSFTVINTSSTTGYTNFDYLQWPVALQALLILLMIIGGMSGSTAGGVKCVRFAATVKQLFKELKQVVHPRAVYAIKFNEHSVPSQVISSIWGFVFLYYAVFSVMTLIFTLQGFDLVSSGTAAFTALSNVGPAMGEFGPYDNYTALNDLSKFVFIAGMLLGRLEFYTLMVLFTFDYWKK